MMTISTMGWRWHLLMDDIGMSTTALAYGEYNFLHDSYTEDGRYYHTLEHIESGLDVLDRLNASLVTKLAWWFHDVVYVAGASDNEELSASRLSRLFYCMPYSLGDAVSLEKEAKRLILLTKHHEVEWWDKNASDMVVADLHGLGGFLGEYRANGDNVRREYGAYDDDAWRVGRLAFLKKYLDQELFPPDSMYNGLRARAQYNMTTELWTLEH